MRKKSQPAGRGRILALAAWLLLVASAASAGCEESAWQTMRVDEVVNIRSGPSLEANRVGQLHPGDLVLAQKPVNGWSMVAAPDFPDQSLGYASAPLLHRVEETGLRSLLAGRDIKITPGLSIRETYDDNVMLKGVDDFEHAVTPSLKLSVGSDLSSLDLQSSAEILTYGTHSEFNRTNQSHSIALTHALDERLDLALRGGMVFDSSFESSLQETGIVTTRIPRSIYSLAPGLGFRLDERTLLRLGGDLRAYRHKDRPDSDYDVRGANLSWERRILERGTTLLARPSVSNTVYVEGKQRTASLLIGLQDALSENVRWSALAGPSHTRSAYSVRGGDATGSSTRLNVQLDLQVSRERSRLVLGAFQDETPTLAGENAFRRMLRTKLEYDFTERLTASVSGYVTMSQTGRYVRNSKSLISSVEPALDYALEEDIHLRLGLTATSVENRLQRTIQEQRRIFLELRMDFPTHLN